MTGVPDGKPLTSEEIRLTLEAMDREYDEISELLEKISSCGECGKDRLEGSRAGCPACLTYQVMAT